MTQNKNIYYHLLLIALLGMSFPALCQISNVEYGKNRVQFHDDFDGWYRYETANFITHWYGKARNNSDFVIKLVEHDFSELERILEHHINDKIEILVFTDLSDLKQSNIGLEDAFENTIGRTKVVGRKIFVHYDGSHINLRRQVREGIAEVYLNDMIHGGNIQQLVKNAISSDLPEWYREGIISYLGDKWNPKKEIELIHLFRHAKHKKFDDLSRINPRLMGNLLWYYLAQQYGHGALSNILYVSRLNRHLDQNFAYILGQSVDEIKKEAYNFAKEIILKPHKRQLNKSEDSKKVINNKKGNITDVQFSPDGQSIIYTVNDIGKVKVFTQNLKSGKNKLLFKKGFRNIIQATDYNYPLITWNDQGTKVYLIHEQKDIIYLRAINIENGKWIEEPMSPEYQRVYSIDYIDAERLLISGTINGLNNMFIYLPLTRESRQINNDFYDDRGAQFGNLKGEPGLLYSSNRPNESVARKTIDTILPTGQSDIFFMSLNSGNKIYQLTHTPDISETAPKFIDSLSISYHSDASGLINRVIGNPERVFVSNNKIITFADGSVHTVHQDSILKTDSSQVILTTTYEPVYKWITKPTYNTDYSQDLKSSDINIQTGMVAEIIRVKKEDRIYVRDFSSSISLDPKVSWYKNPHSTTGLIDKKSARNLQSNIIDSIEENIPRGLLFKSEFPDPVKDNLSIEQDIFEVDNNSINKEIKNNKIERINFSRILGSRLTFHVDDVDFKFDNEILFDGLQNYASSDNGEIVNQPFGLLLNMRVKDLLEDYSVEVGVRYPTNFSGSEYYLVADNNKKRIDKRYAYYRRANTEVLPIGRQFVEIKQKKITNILLSRWKYPLDVYRSLRATFTFRTDDVFLLNSERLSLESPSDLSQRFGLKLEYVFDNSLVHDYNITHGSRYKIFGEVVNKTEIEVIDNWRFKPGKGVMTILGLDARHYQRLDRRSVFAMRLAAATSFGSEKILYYLGGVENWLLPQRNDHIPAPSGDEFAYQSLGVQMRGFNQNIRNGNSFALINTELRIPIFQYFKSYKLRSAFLRNFLITGFFDAGSAWQGTSPFSDDNPLNVITVSNSRSVLRINFFRDPIVYGYGLGTRMYLFGYNVKFDYGWGVDSGERHKGVFYFSIGKDF